LRSAAAIAVTALVAVAGCGGGTKVSSAQRDRLTARVAQARTAAEAHDGEGVRRALGSFRASVRAGRARGEISQDDADRLLTAALQASRRVRAEITPQPTPAATPTPTATAAPAAPAPQPVGKQKGKPPKGKGKGPDKKHHEGE
jgi:hypothetical protein